MSLYGYISILLIILASHLVCHLVLEYVVVTDPASNTLGWYTWSLMITALRWEWYVALLGRNCRLKLWHYTSALFLASFLSYKPGYSQLVYGTVLTPSGHVAMNIVQLLASTIESVALLLLATWSVRHQSLFPLVMLLVAGKIFLYGIVGSQTPVLVEAVETSIILGCYLTLLVSISLYDHLRLNQWQRTS